MKTNSKQKLNEYYKCKNDPIYFLENYVYLEEVGGNTKFKLYEPQKKFLLSLINDHHVTSLKSRQVGISTITQGFVTYVYTFFKNVVTGIVSRDGPEATDFCRKVMSMIDSVPEWMRPKYVKQSEQTFILDNGCKFYASQVNAKKPGGLFRGKSCTIIIIDEAAHIDYIDEAFTGFGPTLVKAQKSAKEKGVPFGTIIISTPNKTTGIGKWFYEIWKDAETNQESIYVPHKIHWTEVKEFRNDPNWYKTQCKLLHNNHAKIQQELEMQFLASTNSFFAAETVEILNQVPLPYRTKMLLKSHEFQMWEPPNPNKFYLIGIDTASASGADNSVIEIIDYVNFEQVAEYVGKMRVDDFCEVVKVITKIYKNSLLIVENNSYGNQVVEFLTKELSHLNIYKQTIKNADYARQSRYRYGLSTNAQTRPLIMDALYTYVTENPNLVKSTKLSLELIGLEQDLKGRVEASRGFHDDMAMALGFCAYVRMYDPPMSVASVISNNISNDIIETINMNMEESGLITNASLSSIKYRDDISIGKTNSMIDHHIKRNLHNLTIDKNSNTIDISELLGFDVVKNERDPFGGSLF